jgi:hypothetical protein
MVAVYGKFEINSECKGYLSINKDPSYVFMTDFKYSEKGPGLKEFTISHGRFDFF